VASLVEAMRKSWRKFEADVPNGHVPGGRPLAVSGADYLDAQRDAPMADFRRRRYSEDEITFPFSERTEKIG